VAHRLRIRALASGLLLALVTLLMSKLTWLTWCDPIVDYGRELYVPWRLVEGERLYADIAYHNGPFSPYLNAAWFAATGVSYHALVALDFAVLLATLLLLHRLVRGVASRTAAIAGGGGS